jgi:hypothetical protein
MPAGLFPRSGSTPLGTAQRLRVFFCKQAWHGTHVIKVFLRDVLKSHNRKAVFFAVYTFLCLVALMAGAGGTLAWHGPWLVPAVGVFALCLPPLALSTQQVLKSRRWSDFLLLFALYLTFGIARAKSLLSLKNFF